MKNLLQNFLNKSYHSLEWTLNDAPQPPKPHAFVSLPTLSGGIVVCKLKIVLMAMAVIFDLITALCNLLISFLFIPLDEKLPVLICTLFLIFSASLTIAKLVNSYPVIKKKGFFEFIKKYPLRFIIMVFIGSMVACVLRTTVFGYLGLDRYTITIHIQLIIIFSTWLPIVYTMGIINQFVNCTRDASMRGKETRQINIDYSLNNCYINQTITWKNCVLVLIFSALSYYFLHLFPLFLVVTCLGCSEELILYALYDSYEYIKHTLTSLRPPRKMILLRSLPPYYAILPSVAVSSGVNKGIIQTELNLDQNDIIGNLHDRGVKTETSNENSIITIDIGYIVTGRRWGELSTVLFDHLDKTASNLKILYGRSKSNIIRPIPEKGPGWKGVQIDAASKRPHRRGYEHVQHFQQTSIRVKVENNQILTLHGIWIAMPWKSYIEHLESEGHRFIVNSSLHPPRIYKHTGQSWFIIRTHFEEEPFNSRNIEQSGSSYPSTYIGPGSRALVSSNAACSQVQLAPVNVGLAPFNASLSNTYALTEPRLASASARNLRLLDSRNNNWTGVTAPATQEWGVTAPATPQGWGQNSSVVPQSQESLNDSKS